MPARAVAEAVLRRIPNGRHVPGRVYLSLWQLAFNVARPDLETAAMPGRLFRASFVRG